MYTNLSTAADKLFAITNAKRVIATKGKSFHVCSRSCARRLGMTIIAKNY